MWFTRLAALEQNYSLEFIQKTENESDRLRSCLKTVFRQCDNLRKRKLDENGKEWQKMDNEPFISSVLYPNLFPQIVIGHQS